MVAINPVRRETFDMGRVVSRTFEVIQRNLIPFGLLTVLLAGLPAFLVGWWQLASVSSTVGNPGAVMMRGLLSIVFALITMGLLGVLQAAIVFGSIRDLDGRRPELGELLSVGLRFALPAVGISLIYAFSVGIGCLLLIVPGLLLAVMWSVALPAAVVERIGVFSSLSRSGELTKGSRWRIFGLTFLYFLAVMIVEMVILGLTGAFTRPVPGVALSAMAIFPRLIVQFVLNTINYMIASTGVAVIYQELRTLREGVLPASLGSVFD